MTVRHEILSGTFLTGVEGEEARLTYQLQGNVMVITHTYVPPKLRGKGVAAILVENALSYAQQKHLKVDPQCSYVDAMMRKNQVYGSLRI